MKEKGSTANFESQLSSYDVFMTAVRYTSNGIDCSGMLESGCYDLWVRTRSKPPAKPENSFRKALTSHFMGRDGRRPFPPLVEQSLNIELQKKRVWKCFKGTDFKIGLRGFRSSGYWETNKVASNCRNGDNVESKSGSNVSTTISSKKETSRPKSSKCAHSLFMKYVKKQSDGCVNVNGLLSCDCYNAWMKTFAANSVQPEEAFRIAVTSQCQGIDGYLPFAPNVERALLAKLRERKVWDCFKHTNVKIGKKGYKATGFWEKKRLNGELYDDKDTNNFDDELIECAENGLTDDFLLDIVEQLDHNSNILHNLSELNPKALTCVENKHIEYGLKRFEEALNSDSGSIKQMAAGLWLLNRQNIRSTVTAFVCRMGVEVFDQKNLKQLDILYSQNHDFLCSREFAMPSKPYQKFDISKPIGCCVGDTVQFITLETDDVAKRIYKGDITGKHSMEMRISEYHSWMYSEEMLISFVTRGEVWTRTLERRFDGSPLILLNHFCTSPIPTACYCFIQDITEEFGHYLPPSVYGGKDCMVSRKRSLLGDS